MKTSVRSATLSLLCFGLMTVSAALGQTFSGLDPTFGSGGKVVTNFGQDVRPSDAIQEPDGKIVISTDFYNTAGATIGFGVARYQTNGALDGFNVIAFTNFINYTNGIAVQPDGKIVVVGEAESADGTLSEFAIARFNTDLSLDPTFGAGGMVTTNFVGQMNGGVSNPADSVLIQPDGKILVGGSAQTCGGRHCPVYTAIARYNPDGSLDATFGDGGEVMVLTDVQAAETMAVVSTGDILVVNGSAIAQFTATGQLESTVTSGTIVAASHGGLNEFQRSDSKYILASTFEVNRRDVEVQMLRFTATGQPDSTFNNPPFQFGPEMPEGGNVAQAAGVLPDGKIVAAGYSNGLFGVARLNTNGSLDTTFGAGGKLTTGFGNGGGQILAVALQSDNRFVAVGQTEAQGGNVVELALARYR